MSEVGIVTEPDPTWERLNRDLKKAASTLGRDEARFLVDYYYLVQGHRIRLANQIRALEETSEPHTLLDWMLRNARTTERDIQTSLDIYSDSHIAGKWARSQVGIGPVLAAGLLAHIDPKKALTAGKVWRFAGLDPTVTWEKGQKRPWNAALKLIAWKIGDSFRKTHNRDGAYYGKAYKARKQMEVHRNESGDNRAEAERTLQTKNWARDNVTRRAYEKGVLPDGRIDNRAARWATKLFLSHYQTVLYESTFNQEAPKPWVIAFGGHVDYLEPPGWAEMKAELGLKIRKK